jgi:hypothetical protein
MKDVPKFKKALSNIVKKKEEKKYIETGKDGILLTEFSLRKKLCGFAVNIS